MKYLHPLTLILILGAFAMAAEAPAPDDQVQDRGWPRAFETAEYDIIVYQPQVDEWPDFERITFRAAISVTRKGEDIPTYGTVKVSAATNGIALYK